MILCSIHFISVVVVRIECYLNCAQNMFHYYMGHAIG